MHNRSAEMKVSPNIVRPEHGDLGIIVAELSPAQRLRAQTLAEVFALLARWVGSEALQHHGARGGNREELLRDHLESRLPRRFQVGTGLIVDSRGQSSGQHDVVIADAMYTPVILPQAPNGVYPIDSIHCAIEVRSRVVKKLSRDLSEMADRFVKLLRLDYGDGGIARYTPPRECDLGEGRRIVQTGMYAGKTDLPWRIGFYWIAPQEDPESVARELHCVNEGMAVGNMYPIDAVLFLARERDSKRGESLPDPHGGFLVGYTEPESKIYWQYRGDGGRRIQPVVLWPSGEPDARGEDTFAFWFANLLNFLNGQTGCTRSTDAVLRVPVLAGLKLSDPGGMTERVMRSLGCWRSRDAECLASPKKGL